MTPDPPLSPVVSVLAHPQPPHAVWARRNLPKSVAGSGPSHANLKMWPYRIACVPKYWNWYATSPYQPDLPNRVKTRSYTTGGFCPTRSSDTAFRLQPHIYRKLAALHDKHDL